MMPQASTVGVAALVLVGLARLGRCEEPEPEWRHKKVYDYRECHWINNGRANLTLCSLDTK